MPISKLGPNKFRVAHFEMRTLPQITFKGLPTGVTAKVFDASRAAFTVQFEPETIAVEKFEYELSVEP
jgi:hypothetical protein